jgi:hypothetical protein
MYRLAILKTIFILALLLSEKQGKAQITGALVLPIKIDQKIITASIDNKKPATFVLKQFEVSDIHSSVYSVKGYYFYDNDKNQIPLAGVYSGDYVLTLYSFADDSKDDTLLNLNYQYEDFWKSIDHFKNMNLFKEKFIFEELADSLVGHRYFSDGTKQPVVWNNYEVNITENLEILNITQKAKPDIHINLLNLGYIYKNYKVVSYKQSEDQLKILIEFKYPSRHYLMGVCGSGQEYGLVMLDIDENGLIIKNQDFILESCLREIGFDNLSTRQNYKYRIVDHYTDRDYQRILTINKSTLDYKITNEN